MMHQPLVSIIITSYNYASFIREAIDSALAQTYPDIEVIIVDDGSKDESPEIISSYGDLVKSVMKKNGGQGSAFNAGYEISRGEIIIFLDADDYLDKEAVDMVVREFNDDALVKVHWPLRVVDKKSRNTGELTPSGRIVEGKLLDVIVKWGPNSYTSPPTSGNAWRRKYLEQVMPMPSDAYVISADNYLCMLAPVYGLIKTIEKPLSYYRMHGDNNYRGKSLSLDLLQEKVERFENSSELLIKHLSQFNIPVDREYWRSEAWLHKLDRSVRDIKKFVKPNEKFILADGDQWQVSGSLNGWHIIPIMENNKAYWGPPANDEIAIQEIERLMKLDAGYIFFAWPVFWWLQHYTHMVDYLNQQHQLLISNDRIVGYKLDKTAVAAI